MSKSAAAKTARLSKEEKAILEAERLAKLLSSAPAEAGDPLAPPAFVTDPRLAAALAVWRELQPQLKATGRLSTLDRLQFAALCYWHAEWIAAIDDIHARGYSFMAKATAGGRRPWINPSVTRRDRAWDQMGALAAKFGLTPLDRIALNKNRGMIHDDLELPLGSQGKPADAPTPEPDAEASKWSKLLN